MRALGFSTIKNYRLGSIINARDETVQPAVHMLPGPDLLLASLSTLSLAFILHWCQHQICSAVSASLSCSLQLISVHYPSPSAELCWIWLPQIYSPLRNRCSWDLSSQEIFSCSKSIMTLVLLPWSEHLRCLHPCCGARLEWET